MPERLPGLVREVAVGVSKGQPGAPGGFRHHTTYKNMDCCFLVSKVASTTVGNYLQGSGGAPTWKFR